MSSTPVISENQRLQLIATIAPNITPEQLKKIFSNENINCSSIVVALSQVCQNCVDGFKGKVRGDAANRVVELTSLITEGNESSEEKLLYFVRYLSLYKDSMTRSKEITFFQPRSAIDIFVEKVNNIIREHNASSIQLLVKNVSIFSRS